MSLGIKDNGISFKKYQVSAWDDKLFVASDKYDDRMSGNIKIPDLLICPWISLLESKLFQLNAVFILKRFRTDHHYIPGFQNRITLGDEDAVITLDYCNNDSLWKIKFSNAVSDPFVVLVKADADKMHIFFLSYSPIRFRREY